MEVNKQLLKDHLANFKLNKNNAAEYYVQLFTLHPEMADYYGADGIEPESLCKSQKFIMQGMQEFQCFFRLVDTYGDGNTWRGACANFKEIYSDRDIPLNKFSIVGDALIAAISKHAGEASGEQKESWKNLIKKASEDMKAFGWY
uniref:GLOBIN domain-containing protein n=1 Tax=Strongyloides papillosus TaxID=174720 RepID=A0A0N5CGY4_STREA